MKDLQRNSNTLQDLLDSSGLSKKVDAFGIRAGERPDFGFWEALRNQELLTDEAVEALRFKYELQELVDKTSPTFEKLVNLRKCGTIRRVSDVFRLDWEHDVAIGSDAAVAPSGIAEMSGWGGLRDDCRSLLEKASRLFPSAAIVHWLRKKVETDLEVDHPLALIVPFFDGNPDFDLQTTNICAFLTTRPDALEVIETDHRAACIDRIKKLQRLFRITADTPNQFAAIQKLIDEDVDSSQAVAGLGVESFNRKLAKNSARRVDAHRIHSKAMQRSVSSLALFSKYSPSFDSVGIAAIGQKDIAVGKASVDGVVGGSEGGKSPAVETAIPDWEKLFGAVSRYQCEHCRSVLSPAAYLVDLMDLLGKLELTDQVAGSSGSAVRRSALEVLFDRRPDIARIELSCANTDTTLPYVDLVIEALENAVLPLLFDIDDKEIVDDFIRGAVREVSSRLEAEFSNNDWSVPKGTPITFDDEKDIWRIAVQGNEYTIALAENADRLIVTARLPTPQTSRRAADLSAYPEHLNVEVYEWMKNQDFSWAVPFDLWAEEARVYLAHLGIPRHRLMELFLPGEDLAESIAAEYFGLTKMEMELVTGAVPEKPWRLWGEEQEGAGAKTWTDSLGHVPVFLARTGLTFEELIDLLDVRYITGGNESIVVSFPKPRSLENGITTSRCDYTQATIHWPGEPALFHRIYCFLRLQRKTNWSIAEFDRVLGTLGYHQLYSGFDGELLVQLRRIHEIQGGLELPLEVVLRWFAPTNGSLVDDNIHSRLLVGDPVPSIRYEASGSNIDPVGTAADDNHDKFMLAAENASFVCGVLRISYEDLTLLAKGILRGEHAAPESAENLSFLLRAVSIARGLKLSIRDFLSLRAVTGIHPENPLDDPEDSRKSSGPMPRNFTEPAMLFVRAVKRVENLRFTNEELEYLLCQHVRAKSQVVPGVEEVADLMDALRGGLQAISKENSPEAEDDTQRVERLLLQLDWDEASIARLLKLVKEVQLCDEDEQWLRKWLSSLELPVAEYSISSLPEESVIPDSLGKKLVVDAGRMTLQFRGWMSEGEREILKKLFGATDEQAFSAINHPDVNRIENPFFDAASVDQLLAQPAAARISGISNRLYPYAQKVARRQLLQHKVADALNIDPMTAEKLLASRLRLAEDDQQTVIASFLRPQFSDSYGIITSTEKSFPDQYQAFRLLHKAAMLIDRFRIEVSQVEWLFDSGTFGDTLDLNELPHEESYESAPDLFGKFLSLADLFAARDELGEEATVLLGRLEGSSQGNRDAGLRELGRLLEVDIDDLGKLVDGVLMLNGENTLPGGSSSTLRRVQECLAALNRLGVSVDLAESWARDSSFECAKMVRQAAEAKHDEEQWLAVATDIRSGIREKQRSTLVDYLMAKRKTDTASSLYQHYLIDVEMDSCMMTSRTKLAISSVQLFIQRLVMNLEDWRIPQNQADFFRQRWQWLKNYRVWEASRKVFLYPENWIEPDLRKDKTELFRSLESEILQGELTTATAERAVRNYVVGLDELGSLEICGVFLERETTRPRGKGRITLDVLHVFGRTQDSPRVYYYRRRAGGLWTAWEEVETSIDDDHLIPVVLNRRLYLFWPVFAEQTRDELRDASGERLKTKDETVQTWEYWEVRLAFSEYRQGAWTPKKILDGKHEIDLPPESIDPEDKPYPLDESNDREKRERSKKSDFTFKTKIDDTSVCILCGRRNGDEKYESQGGFQFTNDERVRVFSGAGIDGAFKTPFKNVRYHGMALSAGEGFKSLQINDQVLFGRTPLRNGASRGVRLVCSHQLPMAAWLDTFIYQDEDRTFLVTSDPPSPGDKGVSESRSSFPMTHAVLRPSGLQHFRVENLYHPAVADFISRLNRSGLQGLLSRSEQDRLRETNLFWVDGVEANQFDRPDEIERVLIDENRTIWEDRGLVLAEGARVKDLIASKTGNPGQWNVSFSEGTGDSVRWECSVREEDGALLVYQDFNQQYQPQAAVEADFRTQGEVDFSVDGAYSFYNWELFFHVPLLLADRLSKNQRFQEAQEWFHHLFDPTDLSDEVVPQRYWKVREFYREGQSPAIPELVDLALADSLNATALRKRNELATQIAQWRKNPFDPHVIARFRLSAYQKTVVMKYLDNLIAWADQLFRRDSIESINEATQLYILAAEILGQRPLTIASETNAPVLTSELLSDPTNRYYDAFKDLEDLLPDGSDTAEQEDFPPSSSLALSYFCVPGNGYLLSYWDTVEERLFKIRHCQNIEGTERQLALFEPPIDPGMLVRAASQGGDIRTALRDINVPLPCYRFQVMLQKAVAFCEDVKVLGAEFLGILEKKDAAELERLCSEQRSYGLQRAIKQRMIEEAIQKVADLETAKVQIEKRIENFEADTDYWKLTKMGIGAAKNATGAWDSVRDVAESSRGTWNRKNNKKAFEERAHARRTEWEGEITRDTKAQGSRTAGLTLASTMYGIAGTSSTIPTVITGGAGMSSPVALVVNGGEQLVKKSLSAAKVAETAFKIAEVVEEVKSLYREFKRAEDEAKRHKEDAMKDRDRLEKQISAAQICVEIAKLEKKKIDKQIENTEQLDVFMRNRFTNLELYSWQVSKLSTLYFQTYKMAYDLAKRAEKAFHYELGETKTDYIRFGYWDSMKKGLLGGDQLCFDLRRMEKDYLDRNKRGFEITKHVSLAGLAPGKLIELKGTGQCELELPEWIFDIDYPGHFKRRIKSVSVTIVGARESGPHTNVNCTLTLLKNEVRMSHTIESESDYPRKQEDSRFRDEVGAIQSIVTSSGKDDSGLFALDFQDDRYLPFEGAGAISKWKIDLPHETNLLDVGSISDFVLHINYTACEGGEALKKADGNAVQEQLSNFGLVRLVDLRGEFEEDWRAFGAGKELILDVDKLLPSSYLGRNVTATTVTALLDPLDDCDPSEFGLNIEEGELVENGAKEDGTSRISRSPTKRLTGKEKQLTVSTAAEREKDASNVFLLIGISLNQPK